MGTLVHWIFLGIFSALDPTKQISNLELPVLSRVIPGKLCKLSWSWLTHVSHGDVDVYCAELMGGLKELGCNELGN